MADDKKTPASAKKTKPAAEAKPAAKAKAEAKPPEAPGAKEAKAEAKPAAKPAAAKAAKVAKPEGKAAKGKATPSVTDGPACRAEKCRQPVRAKGYCRKHYMGWRRGDLGDHHRYKICSKEGCRKPRAKASLCDEHAGTGAPAAAEGAAPA